MSETPPPRRPLATFLRATPAAPSLIPTPVVPAADAPLHAPPVPGRRTGAGTVGRAGGRTGGAGRPATVCTTGDRAA
ncbi:hypothetical protein A7D01_09760 [Xanthomonas arboricola]|uniref:hypothetical protein n=1 Tax=Xanthomonas arboricola TaxID=56448 RepID=UPI0007ECE29E|nr:hypothetical protein A7D01_09760 [Xanthomonas arboricola]